jgi:hypothetical protein
MISSEAAIANLFRIAQTVNTPATPVKLISRRWRMYKDVTPDQLPSLFQFQSPTRRFSGGVRPLLKQEYRILWMLYLPMSQTLNDVVSPALNRYCDLLINALLTTRVINNGAITPNGMPAGTVQDLGFPGKVQCYVDGDGLTDEGLLSTYSLLVLPITILTGI